MKNLFIIIIVYLNLNCFVSEDGLFDSQQCASMRESYEDYFYSALIMYIAADCINSNNFNNYGCQTALGKITGFTTSKICDDEPEIPFPWHKKRKKDIWDL